MGGIVALLWDFGPLVLELRRIPLLGSSVNRGNPPYPLMALFLVRVDRGLNKELQVGAGLR
jgi:hypothetical protein